MARKKAISDDEVLDAALPVMIREGPAGFTLAKLAAETGIAPATLIQRFNDKKTLINRVFARDNERFAEWIAAQPKGRGVDKVLALFSPAEAYGEDDFADHILWLREDFRDPALNKLSRARFRMLRKAIAERMPPTRVSPHHAARLLEAQWQGALNQWGFFREGRLGDYVIKSLKLWFEACGSPRRPKKL
jgi:AcrR family transcriptional regulator